MKKFLLTLFILLIPFTTLPQFNNPENEKKVDPLILKELRIINIELDNGKTLNKELAKSKKINWTRIDDNGRILVSISYTNISIKNKLLDLGCEIKTEGSEQLYVWIPYEKIENVVELEEVIKIRSLGIGKTRSVTGEGFMLHKGNLAQTSYGTYGQGIKVGVISDGIAEWQASYQNGDLPQNVNILDPGTTEGTEGTAMMEIVYDFAPQSNYYFAGVELSGDGPLDMANNILNLSGNGCKVIVDDIGWPGGYSYFQEKEISWAINSFVSPPNNGCYISAAGNDADIMYSGDNYSWLYNQQDNKYYLYWDLSMTDRFNDINLVDIESMIIFFQWADDWDNPVQDFKMVWCDAFGNTLEESEGMSPQQVLEFDEGSPYLNGNYKLKIQSDDPASVVELKIIFDYTKNPNNQNSNANIEYLTTSKHIFGHPIVDNVISVAAVNFNENLVEFFSSRGPAIISNGLVTIENEQPKITGADGVSTFVWGAEGFSGTSAAAPHIAGVAAQYFSEFPNDSYSEFLFHLKSSALPLEDGNPNHWSIKSGYGIADSYGTINHKYGSSAVYIRQLDKYGTPFGEAKWYSDVATWTPYGPYEPVPVPIDPNQYWKATQDYKPETNEKYHHWAKDGGVISDVQNHKKIGIQTGQEILTAQFYDAVNTTVQISLDGVAQNNGILKFKDPWYFEDWGAPTSQYWDYWVYSYRNRGMSQIPEDETSPLNFYTTANYKGVFLDQLYQSGTYYSSEVAQTQTLSGKQSYFVNWSATGQTGIQGIISPNSLNTPIVFKEEGAVVSANYHAAQQSNYSNAYLNPGQRKFIKTTNQQYGNNYFHKVYESHGNVWYEMSSDGGNTWQIMNNGQPLNTGGGSAKYPSIDYSPDYYYPNQVLIVFLEERLEPIHEYYIMAQFYDNGIFQYESIVASNEEDYYVGELSKPVVARRSPTFLVAWDDSPLLGSRGLMYRLGQLGAQIYWNTDALPVEFGLGDEYRNPSLAISKSGTGLGTYRLAFDKGSYIMGVNLEVFQTGTYPPYSVRENSGYGFGQAGFSQNYQPSISVMPNNDFRISWFGYNNLAADDGLKGSLPLYEKKVVTWLNHQFYVFGTNVSSHSMSVTDDGRSIVAYGDNNGASNKFRQIWYYTLEKGLGTVGKQTHLSNGSSLSNMYAMSFQNAVLPYSFSMSANLGSLQKVTEIPIACGRRGIVIGDSAEFYFTLGDVTLNENKIDFIQTGINPDFSNLDTLNYYLSTEKFNVTNSSQFDFSIEYGVTDSLKAVQSLDENDYVRFKLQLINTNTNNVIGEYTVVTFTKDNIIPYFGKSFSINTNGIGNKKVRVRFVAEENINGGYAMANIYAEESVLPKQNLNIISYSGSEVVTEYALEQNYPNPFNPSTIIKYQIPKDGSVTLKVYDILGSEVATLVNEEKIVGKYEVIFDANRFASGVYIYRLSVNDFVNVKKMILLK